MLTTYLYQSYVKFGQYYYNLIRGFKSIQYIFIFDLSIIKQRWENWNYMENTRFA